jgi:hypothetical protein
MLAERGSKLKKNIAFKTLALVVALGSNCWLSAHAVDEQKADLVQLIRQQKGGKSAMAVTKLMTFNFSPAWWAYFLDQNNSSGYQLISNLADALMTFGQNMGGDDITALDQSRDGSSPLVADAINNLATKTHCTLEMVDAVNKDTIDKVIDNFAMIGAPIDEKYYCKPRGGKLFLTLTLDAKAKAMRCDISKDGNTYHFFLPAYMQVTTSPVEEALKRGT